MKYAIGLLFVFHCNTELSITKKCNISGEEFGRSERIHALIHLRDGILILQAYMDQFPVIDGKTGGICPHLVWIRREHPKPIGPVLLLRQQKSCFGIWYCSSSLGFGAERDGTDLKGFLPGITSIFWDITFRSPVWWRYMNSYFFSIFRFYCCFKVPHRMERLQP